MGATLESTFEKRLIEQLTRGISQWTYRQDLKTEEDLWRNFRQKIEQNNVAVLDGHPLTEQEFRQIQNQLQNQQLQQLQLHQKQLLKKMKKLSWIKTFQKQNCL